MTCVTPSERERWGNGASIAVVQKVMGHKSIETTMQYVHATDEGKRRVVEAVEKTRKSIPSNFPVTNSDTK
jgi:integrase